MEGYGAGVKALAGGVGPRPGRETEVTSGVVHRLERAHGSPRTGEPVAPVIGEDDAVGIVGVATDAQMAEVV